MSEYSDAAVAAYPDDLHDSRYGPSSSWMNDRERAAFDRGAASRVPPSEDVAKLIEPIIREFAEAVEDFESIADSDQAPVVAEMIAAALAHHSATSPLIQEAAERAIIHTDAASVTLSVEDAQAHRATANLLHRLGAALAALRSGAAVPVETVESAADLPVGSVILAYYYPPAFAAPAGLERTLARLQLTRGRQILHGERVEYSLSQVWERIEVLFRPTREENTNA